MCGDSILKSGYRCVGGQQVCQIAELEYNREWMRTEYKSELANYRRNDDYLKQIAPYNTDITAVTSYRCACGDGYINNGETCRNQKQCTNCTHVGTHVNDNGYLDGECKDKKIQYMRRDTAIGQSSGTHGLKISQPDLCLCVSDIPERQDAYYCEMVSVHKDSYAYGYEYNGWICGKDQCECGTEVCRTGEQCSNGHCVPNRNQVKQFCPALDVLGGITYKNETCYCNGVPMASKYLNAYEYICENGTAWKCRQKSCHCGELRILMDTYCLGDNLCGGNPYCYDAFNNYNNVERNKQLISGVGNPIP
jgi:hypothetical protein